ncbi:PQQ-binding-like beta-propeller repeat protein [Streptomyces sp. NPDC092296]|uniref:protein kinase domain-containing protein n=1 Tax=Streptomyces sp. NPDC092296 TaxID=3366012 RepID=UPI0038266937
MNPLEADDPAAIGPYRLLARLGAGGMGRVYLARSAGGRTVAVKVVRPELAGDEDFRRRFRREVAAARAVQGVRTAPVVDADRDSAVPWLATAYVLGPSLAEAVARFGPLPASAVRALGAGLAEALVSVHAAGLVHRDLKPSNVLLSAEGPRVIDFGIARAVDGARMTGTGIVVGSPGFMSPEQAAGQEVGPAADVFSLGSVLAYAATGEGPFGESTPAALLYRVVHDRPDLARVPEELRPVLAGCLAKEPAERPTPQQLAAVLAPQGVDAALAGGWLPAAVSSSIASHAAEVMAMETPAHGQPAAPGGDPDGGGSDGTVRLRAAEPAEPAEPIPASRRRFLLAALVGGGVAVGGTAAWAFTRGGGGATPVPGPTGSPSASPARPSLSPTARPSRAAGVPPQPLWTFQGGSLAQVAVTPYRGAVHIAGEQVTTLDGATGRKKWDEPGPGPNLPVPIAVGAGLVVYLTGGDGQLVALDAATGSHRWTYREPARIGLTTVLCADDRAVYLTGNQYPLDAEGQPVFDIDDLDNRAIFAYAIGGQNPRQLWMQRRKATADDWVLPVLSGDHLVYTDSSHNVVARSTRTGEQLWSGDAAEVQIPPTVQDGTVYLGGAELQALDLRTGAVRWSLPAGSKRRNAWGPPLVAGGTVYACDATYRVNALSAADRSVRWSTDKVEYPGDLLANVLIGDVLFVPAFSDAKGVYALDARTGEVRWNFRDGQDLGRDWQLSTDGERLYAVHGDRVYGLPPE